MSPTIDFDPMIARYAVTEFDDSTSLLEAGLESLSLLRLAVDVATDDDAEIDAAQLVDLRTVKDLKQWLARLAIGGGAGGDTRC